MAKKRTGRRIVRPPTGEERERYRRALHEERAGMEANKALGFPPDLRDYGIGAQILVDLGVRKMKLLTNNPKKVVGLKAFSLEIVERVPIEIPANENNIRYLSTKRDKLGHILGDLADERSTGTDRED